VFVKELWSKSYLIIPIYSEGVKTERLEVIQILKLGADALDQGTVL